MPQFPSSTDASGIWKMNEILNFRKGFNWPLNELYITNLRHLYDAALSETVNGSTWTDIANSYGSTGAVNLTNFNSPVYTSNSLQSFLSYNGSNQYSTGINTLNLSAFTIYVWLKTTTTATSGTFYTEPTICGVGTGGAPSRDFGLTIKSGYAGVWQGINSTGDLVNQPTNNNNAKVNTGEWFEIICSSSTVNGTRLFVNQTQIGTALSHTQNLDAVNNFYIGVSNGGSFYCNMDLALFALYTEDLSTENRALNWNFLRSRFGR